jgi:Recombination endonuclease VII
MRGNMAKKLKLYGMRKYWPHLTETEARTQRELLSKKQSAKCGICGKPESSFKMKLAVDHNHKTGQVRGLLCYRCNKFIVGRHTFESAERLLKYLSVEQEKYE